MLFSFMMYRLHWVRPWRYWFSRCGGPKVCKQEQLTHSQWCGLLQWNHCNIFGRVYM